ncbi:hypothetical protein GALMADRAFT_242672 [Galerina marginata CBS 339.88]|uniref:Uncharacterized protein n=1 Tax=Galerina marginata (strain CBS 339.88) TaxID=685588 RepID=A0A067TD85_GALM3|nr:hypothetical protein GALMADRAFT_242672 [Galerina marginata CBS 339.88]
MTSPQGQALLSDAPSVSEEKPPFQSMRRRANTSLSSDSSRSSRSALKYVPVSIYSHVSTYRSSKVELQLYSPSLKVHEDGRGPIAVFGDHDQVTGKVTLDSSCHHTGRLTISIEGSISYVPPKNLDEPATSTTPRTHVFLSSTTTIAISNSEGSSSRSVFRDAFIRRRPSSSSINLIAAASSERSHPFAFSLPQSTRSGEEMPATFTSSKEPSSPDYFEVVYKVVADWDPSDTSEALSHLEVPFLIQPDTDFQCADASTTTPESWLEMPLKSDRPIPVRCAITLPTSVTFSRSSSIPYFVVFTTTPRSPELAKEIAADATISVSLIRQIVLTDQSSLPPTPPLTPSSDESDTFSRPKILRRVAKSQPRLSRFRRTSEGTISFTRDKPLPEIPIITKSFSDTRTVQNDMCIGFPKRPRQQCDKQSHPSLETIAALPDGLHKTKIPLNKDILPCIDWAGVSVKYYLDVSVLLGPDDLRARIPIRIV